MPLFNTHSDDDDNDDDDNDDDDDGINKTRLFLNIYNDFVTAAAIFCVKEVNKKIHVKLNRKRMFKKQNLSHIYAQHHMFECLKFDNLFLLS